MNAKIRRVGNKTQDTNSLVLKTKISELENKPPDHAKYVLRMNFCRWIFAAKLTQAILLSKIAFYNKLLRFNRKITSHKTKYLKAK